MRIHFHDDPARGLRPREEVRFNQIGIFVYEDGRRVALGFDITPFQERPSIEVLVKNDSNQEAASLSVIEVVQPNFNLTLHLRDQIPTDRYEVEAILYYSSLDQGRMIVDSILRTFDANIAGEQ